MAQWRAASSQQPSNRDPAGEHPYFATRESEHAEDPYGHYVHHPAPSAAHGGYSAYPPGKTYSGGFHTGDTAARHPKPPRQSRFMDPRKLGPKGYQRSDERIGEEIAERLARDDYIDARDVELHVKDGRVTLQGSVPERRMKYAIEDLVDDCFGVRDLDNRIHVRKRDVLGVG